MLLGAFPFEHSTSSAADEQRAFNEVHFEQIRIHWTENERNRDIVQVRCDPHLLPVYKHRKPEYPDLFLVIGNR